MNSRIPRRTLGATGIDVSVLGLGGFHQVETNEAVLAQLLDAYLEAGGNYVETARSYGAGSSEEKLGRALAGRRDQVVLVSKSGKRDADGAWRELNQTLEALQTDHLDVWLYHGVNTAEDVDSIAASGGASEASTRARDEGMVRVVGASSHWPLTLVTAMEQLNLDAVMYWVNYLVTCNYPELYQTVAPAARARGLGIIGMKPVGDGYLYRNAHDAFTYAMAQQVDVLACGFNSMEMLQEDIEAVAGWQPQTDDDVDRILREAPELGDYVCRQCGQCRLADMDLPKVFELEGKYDRQMFDGRPHSAPDYALRERLRFWFSNQERAMALYEPLAPRVQRALDEGMALPDCPYGIDLAYKLRLAHLKLTGGTHFPRGVSNF